MRVELELPVRHLDTLDARAADRNELLARERRELGIDALAAVEARDRDASAREIVHGRDGDRRARVVVREEERAEPDRAAVRAPRASEDGTEHDADGGATFLGEADHHAELAVLRDEVARAVDGIDEERSARGL